MTQYYYNAYTMPAVGGLLVVSPGFDATRKLFDVPDVVPLMPFGRLTTPKALTDICDERAAQIYKTAVDSGKKIYLYWSGGIDSTAALVALLKQGVSKELVLVMNSASIAEYPEFYSKYVDGKLAVNMVEYRRGDEIPIPVQHYLSDGIVCTGELGDQMFGAGRYVDTSNTSLLLTSWKDKYGHNKEADKYEAFAATCPVPINNLKEFWWWINYTVKYTNVAFRMLLTSYKFQLEKDVFHFFHTTDFNDWAVSTPMEERFYGTDLRKYKQPLKDYIYEFTKDSNYKINKIKEGSLDKLVTPRNFGTQHLMLRKVSTDWVISR